MKARNADVFGQLVMKNAVENVVNKAGKLDEIKYSPWSAGALQAGMIRTLEEIADVPFVSTYYQVESRVLI